MHNKRFIATHHNIVSKIHRLMSHGEWLSAVHIAMQSAQNQGGRVRRQDNGLLAQRSRLLKFMSPTNIAHRGLRNRIAELPNAAQHWSCSRLGT
jgi:hypothetical protein